MLVLKPVFHSLHGGCSAFNSEWNYSRHYRQEPHVHTASLSVFDVAHLTQAAFDNVPTEVTPRPGLRMGGDTLTQAIWHPSWHHGVHSPLKKICLATGKALATFKSFKWKCSWWWMWQHLWLTACSLDLSLKDKHKPSPAGSAHLSVCIATRGTMLRFGLCITFCHHLGSLFYQQTHYPDEQPVKWGALFVFPSTLMIQWIYNTGNTWAKRKIKKTSL